MQRKRDTFFLSLLATGLLAGCGPHSRERAGGADRPLAGAVVRVACPDAVSGDVVREHTPGWSHRTGAEVRVVDYDPSGEQGPPADADLWVLAAAELPRWAAAGALAPLPAGLKTDPAVEWPGLLPLYREHLLVWDRTAYGLPLLGDAPLCFYRADLLADPKHGEAFRSKYGRALRPPATWQEYADVAEYFRNARHPGRPAPSLPPLPAGERDLDALFYAVAAPLARRAVRDDEGGEGVRDEDLFAFHFDLEGRPRVGAPGFVAALGLLERLQRCRPVAASPEPWRAFRDGDAVLCLASSRRLYDFQKQGSPVRDRVAACPVPGSGIYFSYEKGEKRSPDGGTNRVPYLGAGARVMVVPRAARRPDAALALLAELGGKRTAQQVVLEPRWGGGAVRQAHIDREHWDAFRLEPARAGELRAAIRQTFQHGVRNPVLCLRVPDEREFAAALAAGVRKALGAGGWQDAKAMGEVARRWQDHVRERAADHLRDYRLSLGLQAPGR